jgi:hypothetical protein
MPERGQAEQLGLAGDLESVPHLISPYYTSYLPPDHRLVQPDDHPSSAVRRVTLITREDAVERFVTRLQVTKRFT